MKETYTISRYVSIWHLNEDGSKGDLFMKEAQMGRKICVGKNLIVSTVEPSPKEVDLGMVETGRNYSKKECVDIKTDKGWLHVAQNENLTWLLGDAVEFAKCLDD